MTVNLGRYTDSFKPKEKTDIWTQCEKLFDDKKYSDSYMKFFYYLKDESQDNLSAERNDSVINFQFFQGSKLIKGSIDDKHITAESKIAEFEKPGVAFMRRLMEMNFSLYYSRFAIKDNFIYIKFDSSVLDGSPRKLYFALKELATRADKQDEILLKDFAILKHAEESIIDIPVAEKEIKYRYFQKWIVDALKRATELKEDSFSGGISYLVLNALYKIDYLLVPQGYLMNEFEKIHYTYFARDNKPFTEKNRVMQDEVKKLLEIPKDEILENFYVVKATFGIANPAPHPAVIDVINNNINNVKWYIENKYEDIAVVIYEYIAGYSLFNYGLTKPDNALLRFVLNITTQDYFNEIGFTEKYYDGETKKFNEELVKNKIDGIIKEGNAQFPELKFTSDNLKFDSMTAFLRSYYNEIVNLNFNTE
jgi:hypothetical protein